jgi:hypothetical protein
MPRIKTIQLDSVVEANDKLLGSDVSGVTRNYNIIDISRFGSIGASGFASITGVLNSETSVTSFTADLASHNSNYNILAVNGANSIVFSSLGPATQGKNGTITITNPAAVNSLTWEALASTVYTPGGGSINFDATANALAVLNYFVAEQDKILVNYVGGFASYPQS